MKTLQHTLVAGAVGIAGALAPGLPSQAQPVAAGAPSQAQTSDMSEAEVRKVDKENKKITLKHGTIKSLDMPPMTMVFQVSDAAMLDKVQPGDRIRFKATSNAGKLTVTEIQPVK